MKPRRKLAIACYAAALSCIAVPFFWTGPGLEYVIVAVEIFAILAVLLWISAG